MSRSLFYCYLFPVSDPFYFLKEFQQFLEREIYIVQMASNIQHARKVFYTECM